MTDGAPTPAPRRPARPNLPPLRYWAEVTAVVIGVVAFALLLSRLRGVATSVFLGLFLAIAAEPFLSWMERRGLRRGLAIAVVAVAMLLALAGMVALLVYPAVRQVGQLVDALPELVRQLTDRLERLGVRLDDPAVRQRLEGFTEKAPGVVTTVLGIVGGLVSSLFSALTVIVLALYFMASMPRIRSFAAKALGEPERVEVMYESLDRIGGYVSGQIVVSGTAGVVTGVGLGLLGVPYAAVLGVAMAVFTAVPQVGATIGGILCTMVALTESISLAAVTLLFLLAYQQFENYILAPRVFASAVDLSPVAVFIAVLVGASAIGPVGALTALPMTAALKVVLSYVFRDQLDRIERRKEPVVDTD